MEILQKGQYGVLSMCTPMNEGYGVPLNYAFYQDNIYFHCAKEGSKLDYLRNNNQVSFCVVGQTTLLPSKFGTLYESAIVSGNALEVEGPEKLEALKQLIEKHSGDYIREGNDYIDKLFDKVCVIKIMVKSVGGKARKE
ncbi:MAG: pyridoxamine 5'-phosphate oxidase family protein [Bacteroidota bacterium]|nr:pyridoxamine 5'-phosphate oxidase family protein [Bacteroidota bacterium]